MSDHDHNQNTFERLREQAEKLVQKQPGIPDQSNVLDLFHEMEVAYKELEIQAEELKRAQEELASLHQEYENLYEFAPCGYVTLNSQGIITRANLTAVSLLGANRSSLYRSTLGNHIANSWGTAFLNAREKAAQTGNKQSVELGLKTGNGSSAWVLADIDAIMGEDGSLGGWRIILMDITVRKVAEEERERLQTQLTQAQKMEAVARLAGGVAHDFNNMLSVILGNTEIAMAELGSDQPINENLHEIHKAAQRSSNVVRQLLAFARKQTVAPEVLDLNETVEEMLKMLRRLIGEDIDLSWQPGPNLWPVKIDPTQVDQILANLSVNARDAIAGVGKLTIETGRATFDEAYCSERQGFVPGDFVMLAVSDNGSGMDKETLEYIFEPFFTSKEVGQGTGLGLATVYGIAKQNNGFINVYSEPNQGTTVKIYLPRHRTVDETIRAERDDAEEPHGSETILVVEDETSILKMTKRMLERQGYTVLIAATSGEAMDVARKHNGEINLLMTDVVMPEMNGKDLAGKILWLYPNLKLLFMSGYTQNAIAHHGVLDEGVNFIQKPFSKQDLAVKVRNVLDRGN